MKRTPIRTPKGDFHVWTKRTGNNTTINLWEIPRFVDEVEQVRQALGLDLDTGRR